MTLTELNIIKKVISNPNHHDYEQITIALAIIEREIKLKEMKF